MNRFKIDKFSSLVVFSLLIVFSLTIQNCSEYENSSLMNIENEAEQQMQNRRSSNNIPICHYDSDEDQWFQIYVNEKAWKGHQKHGDVKYNDQDVERLEIGRAMLEMSGESLPGLLKYFTEDVAYYDPVLDIHGKEDVTAFLYQLFAASPNLDTEIHDETYTNNTYSATWTMSGNFFGAPFKAKGISIFKFLPDCPQIYYWRDYYSEGDIMATIEGLDMAIEGFRTYYKCAVDPLYDCPLVIPEAKSNNFFKEVQNITYNQQLDVGRLLVEINAQNWWTILPYLEDDYEYHDPIVDIYGPQTMSEFLGRLFAGSQDLYTVVETETLVNDIYMATWTMNGSFNGAPFSAPGMSIVKFVEGTAQTYYSRDYYTEGDVMMGVPQLAPAVIGYRYYYRMAMDPNFP